MFSDINSIEHFLSSRNESSTSSSSRSTSISGQAQSSSFVSQNSQFRSISFVDQIEFKVNGTVSKHGIVFGDCDNDEKSELIVGTLKGDLLVFKDSNSTPFASVNGLGMISCVLVGDILNDFLNYIITLSIEGHVNIFMLVDEQDTSVLHSSSLGPVHAGKNIPSSVPVSAFNLPPTISDNEVYCASAKLNLIHYQQIQANAMCALLSDIDYDGSKELLVALSDRVVRSYRVAFYGNDIKLIGLHKWEFSDQISSICLSSSIKSASNLLVDNDDKQSTVKSVIVSQQGGLFAKINYNLIKDSNDDKDVRVVPDYCRNIMHTLRNPQVSAEIISDLMLNSSYADKTDLMAMVTNDGFLILINGDNILWHCQLEQHVLALKHLDINGDGNDELIVCNCNGLVYIVNLDGQIITCPFKHPVSAFNVGQYHLNEQSQKCFVYCTFTNSIHLFYNTECSVQESSNGQCLANHIESNLHLVKSLTKLANKLETGNKRNHEIDNTEVDSLLIKTVLYGIPM